MPAVDWVDRSFSLAEPNVPGPPDLGARDSSPFWINAVDIRFKYKLQAASRSTRSTRSVQTLSDVSSWPAFVARPPVAKGFVFEARFIAVCGGSVCNEELPVLKRWSDVAVRQAFVIRPTVDTRFDAEACFFADRWSARDFKRFKCTLRVVSVTACGIGA